MKHWIHPEGIFIMNIPIEWQYKMTYPESGLDEPPYSFESYEDANGSFQISSYALNERGINENFPVQRNNSKLSWLPQRMDGNGFNVHVYYAQVDDQFCMAKYIYSTSDQFDYKIKVELNKVEAVLNSFRLIPNKDRLLAANYSKYDNFLGSLVASYDLWEKAIKNDSYIEALVLSSNQIDAFLRLSIILSRQNANKTNDIEIKYLFQADDEKGMLEKRIYDTALRFGIIDEELKNELYELYSKRNRVIHRFIISQLKTKDIFNFSYEYYTLSEKIRKILRAYEDDQIGKPYGIYGNGFERKIDAQERKRAMSMLNDKHLLKSLYRKV
ncbi:MAG: hypothetical protein ACEPOW_14335 [Bacteroidales bacterium]